MRLKSTAVAERLKILKQPHIFAEILMAWGNLRVFLHIFAQQRRLSVKNVTLVGDEGSPHPPKRLVVGESRQDPCPTLYMI